MGRGCGVGRDRGVGRGLPPGVGETVGVAVGEAVVQVIGLFLSLFEFHQNGCSEGWLTAVPSGVGAEWGAALALL
jgi:hypothetical protein